MNSFLPGWAGNLKGQRNLLLANVSPNRCPYFWLAAIVLIATAVPAQAQNFMTTGHYVGDGSSSRAISGLGFQPDIVFVKGAAAERAVARITPMPPGLAKDLADSRALKSACILSLDADGFTLGSEVSVNEAGVEFYWVAMKAVAGSVELGQYTGNGDLYRNIAVSSLAPEACLVIPAGTDLPVYRQEGMPLWSAYAFDGSGRVSASIVGFSSGSFSVSSSGSTNRAGEDYYFVCWQAQPGMIEYGSYTGDDQPDRDITGLTLDPQYVLLANDGNNPAVHRTASLGGDATLFFGPQVVQNNLVQDLRPGGLQVGTDPSVNASGTEYFWLTFANSGLGADLQVTVAVDDPIPVEAQIVSFTVTTTNLGPAATTGVQIADILPAGLTFQSATPDQGTFDAGTGLWALGSLGVSQIASLTITAAVDVGTSGQILSNQAFVMATDEVDLTPSNDTAEVSLTVLSGIGADVWLSLVADDETPDENQVVTYLLSAGNLGPGAAGNVQVVSTWPTGLSLLSATPDQGTYDQGTGVWDLGNLNVGAVQTITFTASINAGTAGDMLSSLAVVAGLDQVDANSANDTTGVTLTVNTVDLQVTALVDRAAPAEGDTVTYTVVTMNLGPSGASLVQVQEVLPAGLTFVSATASGGSYDAGSGLWNIGSIPPTESRTLLLAAIVDAGTAGTTITGTAAVFAVAETDTNGANDSSSVDIVVALSNATDLQLVQTVDNLAPTVGETVTYTITASNAGPTDGTGIVVSDLLPAEVSLVSSLTNKGAYAAGTGLWTIGDLAVGFQAELVMQATVEPAGVGVQILNTAGIAAADQPDPDASNNSTSSTLVIPLADLQLTETVDNAFPAVGDTVTYHLEVVSDGPNPATGIVVRAPLPAGAAFAAAAPVQGTYDQGTSDWSLGNLNPGTSAQLFIQALILPESAGFEISSPATIVALDQTDPDMSNNAAVAVATVDGADLALRMAWAVAVSFEGAAVNAAVTLVNHGPQAATGVAVTYKIPAGLTMQSASPGQGAYTAASGLWTVGNLAAGDSTVLDLVVYVDEGTAGAVIDNVATVTAGDPADPDAGNNSAVASLTIWSGLPDNESVIWPLIGNPTRVLPGSSTPADVLTFSFVNRNTRPDTLHTMTLVNLTAGGGTSGQMDAEWNAVLAYRSGAPDGGPGFLPTPVTRSFNNGTVVFDRLEWAVPVGDTLIVTVRGAPSLQVRDAAQLRLGVANPSGLTFNDSFSLAGTWPLVSGQILDVDGFAAAQAAIVPRESGLLAIGSVRNLALTVDLPGNGYLDDNLYGVAVVNRGSAEPGVDITGVEVWADDGDGAFDALTDVSLGRATFSGDRWQLTGLNEAVPAGGRRFHFTVDIAETARPTSDIRLGLPVGNGFAVEMFSGNDGPVDVSLENPNTLGISVTDRIILTPEWIRSGVALPGANDLPLLQFVLTNTYGTPRTLDELTFTNTSEALGATPAQRDALCQQVDLWLGEPGTGNRLGSGIFVGDRVVFAGLNLDLAPDTGTRLVVTADLGLTTIADGARVTGQVGSIADISIPNATVVASWPLDSAAEWLVNGMTADQVILRDIPVLTLGPGEGPVLAMDLTIPANGYAADELSGVTLINDGSVAITDILAAELWADGGDGGFDAGAGDDILLGPFTLNGDLWLSTVLTWPVPATGSRLFASLTVADTPQDSVTVKLGLPRDGIAVLSGNDGPVDQAVPGTGTLVISTSPLRTTVTFATAATDTGQTGVVTMTVKNSGSETVTDVVPNLDFAVGVGLMSLGLPSPTVVASLASGAETTITWPFLSTLPGVVVLEGNVQGLVNGAQVRRSIVTPTSAHRIYTPVPCLELYPTANLPFSINRGQQGLVPLTLTFINSGGTDVADAQLASIRLRFLEAVDGPEIPPADLVDQIVVAEGTNIYLETTALPTTGGEVDLIFRDPVIITGSEPVTLGLRLDLRLDSSVPSFLVSIEAANWLVATDVVNGANLNVVPGAGAFPVRTGQATIVAPAVGLNVAVVPLDSLTTVPGQSEVLLAEINLSQTVAGDNSSSIDVGRLAFEFHGADGRPLVDPARWLSQISLRSAFLEHFSGVPVVEGDSLVVLQLAAPVTISGAATIALRLVGDIALDSPLGELRALLGPVSYVDARDGNMNNPVAVNLTNAPGGPLVSVLGPATAIDVAGGGAMPAQVSRGSRDLVALNLTLTNPGASGTADVAGDTIVLRFFDAARQPLDPGLYLDRLRIIRGTEMMGFLIDPAAADGVVTVSMAGGLLAPGQSTALQVILDFKPDCPTGTIEVVLEAGGVRAADSITGLPVPMRVSPGTILPLSSGVATVVVPADELQVAGTSLMPPLLAPQSVGVEAWVLAFSNPAPAGSGGIALRSLTLTQDFAKAAGPDLGGQVEFIQLRRGETIVARGELVAAATGVTLVPDSLLVVAAGQTAELTVEIILREDAAPGPLQLVLPVDGVDAGPPGGEVLVVRVVPAAGSIFPFRTEAGHVGSATLAESYTNFPNPFAAGRESTTFAFSLLQRARVSLRVVTPHGELVATILRDVQREPGLYQSDLWTGLNTSGRPVHNGVYLAELNVRYLDGSTARILRKVAVVR